jgi:hypothetical protein
MGFRDEEPVHAKLLRTMGQQMVDMTHWYTAIYKRQRKICQ